MLASPLAELETSIGQLYDDLFGASARADFLRLIGDLIGADIDPTLPDSLPMIGPAPRHSNLWLAFGNQHIGFTTGPATGAAIAAMIGGAPPSFDATAFAPSRYL